MKQKKLGNNKTNSVKKKNEVPRAFYDYSFIRSSRIEFYGGRHRTNQSRAHPPSSFTSVFIIVFSFFVFVHPLAVLPSFTEFYRVLPSFFGRSSHDGCVIVPFLSYSCWLFFLFILSFVSFFVFRFLFCCCLSLSLESSNGSHGPPPAFSVSPSAPSRPAGVESYRVLPSFFFPSVFPGLTVIYWVSTEFY